VVAPHQRLEAIRNEFGRHGCQLYLEPSARGENVEGRATVRTRAGYGDAFQEEYDRCAVWRPLRRALRQLLPGASREPSENRLPWSVVSPEERLAQNEAFFRAVNDRIREIAEGLGPDPHDYEFLCECSDPACVERLTLSIDEYEAVRADARRFILTDGHTNPAIEKVVETAADHVVVEKVGIAGKAAETLDPR
jgi:hypothetical protein